MMNRIWEESRRSSLLWLAASSFLFCGCSGISVNTQPYMGVPNYPAADPSSVQILPAEPTDRVHVRLGEIILDISGQPSRQELEQKLKTAAAKLGANAVFIVRDQTHIFPVVYVDYWGTTVSQDTRRAIIAVAIRTL